MADLQMKTIRYPGINNLYRFMQPDGTYPDLTAGNIISNDAYNEDTEPYLFRALPYKSKRLEEDLVGATVNWNQLVQNPELNTTAGVYSNGGTVTASSGIATLTTSGTQSAYCSFSTDKTVVNHVYFVSVDITLDSSNQGDAPANYYLVTNWNSGGSRAIASAPKGTKKTCTALLKPTVGDAQLFHIYALGTTIPPSGEKAYFSAPVLIDLTAMFGSTIADYIYSLEQATAGSGIAWLKSYGFLTEPYYEYDSGTLKSVNPTAHKMVGKNLFDINNYLYVDGYWSGGVITETSGRRIVYIPCLPNTTYTASRKAVTTDERFYLGYTEEVPNAGGSVYGSVAAPTSQTVGNKMSITTTTGANAKYLVCWAYWGNHTESLDTLQFELGATSTDYITYEEHTYDLGNVPLYGLFQLENNKLKAYGDVRHAEGGTDRNFSVVDLGDLPWTKDSDGYFYSTISDRSNNDAMCEKYMFFGAMGWDNLKAQIPDKQFGFTTASAQKYILVHDSAYTTSTAFKTAVTGIKLQYEKETTTTEDTPSFEKIQSCFPYGTEQYITTNDVPVGHDTKYFKDVITNIAGIPEPPSANGAYELKLTVTDGVASYSWVAV